MKLSIQEPPRPRTMPAYDLKVGEVGEVEPSPEHDYGGTHILKTFHGFVALEDPLKTWEAGCSFSVRKLPTGTVITLTLE